MPEGGPCHLRPARIAPDDANQSGFVSLGANFPQAEAEARNPEEGARDSVRRST